MREDVRTRLKVLEAENAELAEQHARDVKTIINLQLERDRLRAALSAQERPDDENLRRAFVEGTEWWHGQWQHPPVLAMGDHQRHAAKREAERRYPGSTQEQGVEDGEGRTVYHDGVDLDVLEAAAEIVDKHMNDRPSVIAHDLRRLHRSMRRLAADPPRDEPDGETCVLCGGPSVVEEVRKCRGCGETWTTPELRMRNEDRPNVPRRRE